MAGYCLLLLLGSYFGALLQAADYTVDCIDEILALHSLLVVTRRDEGCLIADIGDVGTRETGGLSGQQVNVNAVVNLYVLEMHLEYLHTVVEFGEFNVNLAVETTGTQKSLVENIGAVSGRKDNHTRVCAEAVHLRKELVESILTFVIGAHVGVLAAGTPHSIDFIYEHDARSFLLGFLEEVTHTRGSHAYEHLHEVGARHREERHIGLAGHGLCQEGLAGARRAYKESALGYLSAEIGIALRIF